MVRKARVVVTCSWEMQESSGVSELDIGKMTVGKDKASAHVVVMIFTNAISVLCSRNLESCRGGAQFVMGPILAGTVINRCHTAKLWG